MLKKAGQRVQAYRPGMDIASDCVLVLGQDALANETALPVEFLEAINQGQNLLVFAQRDLSVFHLRMLDRGVRRGVGRDGGDDARPRRRGARVALATSS